MKKIVWVLVLVAAFGLSTRSVYADELKLLSYTDVEASYQVEEELLLGSGWDVFGYTCLGVGAVALFGGLCFLDTELGLMSLCAGILLTGIGAACFGFILWAYSEVENNSAFKLAEISAPKQDDFNWAPLIASDFDGNMNYGAAMAYRF